jgi:hypothetical protein
LHKQKKLFGDGNTSSEGGAAMSPVDLMMNDGKSEMQREANDKSESRAQRTPKIWMVPFYL